MESLGGRHVAGTRNWWIFLFPRLEEFWESECESVASDKYWEVWDVWGCQSVSAKNHRTDAPWGWSLFANGRLERRWRTSKLCWNVNSSNFAFDSSSFELCVHLHGIIVLDIFFINPNSRPLLTFLPFPHGTRRRILAWGPTPPVPSRDARWRPCTAELLQGGKHNSARITQRRFSPWTTWLPSCGSRGSLMRPGWGLPGERWLSWRAFHQGHFFVWPRPEAWICSFQFPGIIGSPFLSELTQIN